MIKTLKTLDTISQPQNVKKYYVAYLTSDIFVAGLTFALIMSIKLWSKASWDTTWNTLWLYYLVFISILVARMNKAVTEYLHARTLKENESRK